MDFMDADLLMPYLTGLLACILLIYRDSSKLYIHMTVPAYRKIQLRYLIILRIVGIKIILSVKLAVSCDLAVCCKSHSHCIFHHLLIEHRKRTGHTCADRACMCIGSPPESCRTAAEYLRLCGKLHVYFKSYDCLVFLTHRVILSYVYAVLIRISSLKQSPMS